MQFLALAAADAANRFSIDGYRPFYGNTNLGGPLVAKRDDVIPDRDLMPAHLPLPKDNCK